MPRNSATILFSTTVVLALALACTSKSNAPLAPTPPAGSTTLPADGSTLKATAPSTQTPINGQKLVQGTPVTLIVANSATITGVPVTYKFEVYNTSNVKVYTSPAVNAGTTTTSHTVGTTLEGDKTYSWQARAEFQGNVGPWSPRATFVAPVNDGYIKGSELYDPLINGKTVGEIHGPVTFIPGVGLRLDSWTSWISYELPETLFEGEFSLLITNAPANTEGQKQKVMGMAQGYDDLTVNDRRMTVEKRGDNPPGAVAWRFITHDDQVETIGNERVGLPFRADASYFWKATWRGNFFNVLINEGGPNGPNMYDFGKPWAGREYDPKPHVIFVGAPNTRSGAENQSIENAIYRQIWVSSRPRPDFANK